MRLTLPQAHDLAVSALVAAGTAPGNADDVARALVAAEADGQAGHGLSRVPAYADQVAAGKVAGRADPVISECGPAALRVDAADGFAYPAIARGLPRVGGMARVMGIAAMAVTNSHHFGMAGYHVEAPAARGLMALAFGNSPAAIAPWGGKRGLFGTNPIASVSYTHLTLPTKRIV